jgi:predicted nucleic acid-binding protein
VRVLLDTNLLIQRPRFEDLPEEFADARFVTAAICLAEVQEGEFSTDPAVRVRAPLDYVQAKAALGPGLPFDDQAAAVYRAICAAVDAQGRQVARRRVDLMIAATALAHDCALATRNPDDFTGLAPLLEIIVL